MNMMILLALLLPDAGYAVIVPGSFHGDEVSAEHRGEWLALRENDSYWELTPVNLTVENTYDPVLDEKGESTGWTVSAPGAEPLLFLRSEGGGISPGPVQPALTVTELLAPGDVHPVGEDEELIAEKDGLYYRRGSVRQRLSDVYDNLYGEGVRIIWAGDLDGDGLNDLIIDDCAHYAIYIGYRLFLSSEAGSGELLGEVAEFTAVSC